MKKEESINEIKRLLATYHNLIKSGKYDELSEEDTGRKLVLPLFAALGWDVDGKEIVDEVVSQEPTAGGKRVDYSFNINSQPVFYLEIKRLKEDLYQPKHAEQAINYGYHRSVKWVVLSDFEGLRIFNTHAKSTKLHEKIALDIKCDEYVGKYDLLSLLSKESIVEGKLNKHWVQEGHIPQTKIAINDLILSNLLRWRDELSRQIEAHNKGYDENEINEMVQCLLNRLIFIRYCEDRKIDKPDTLRNIQREWLLDKSTDIYKLLIEIFKDYTKGYDSSLFKKTELEKIKIPSTVLAGIIDGLYENKKEDVQFDFASIDADVLGNIYEQYLGTLQRGGGGREGYRRTHGIYYTPKSIVDYIIEKTLGRILKDDNLPYKTKENVKILDPACGSGSFLLRAFSAMDDFMRKSINRKLKLDYFRKEDILKDNIYGVDLDPQAVELAKLSLLVGCVYSRKRLPDLGHNIERGNSLISGTNEELRKYFNGKVDEVRPFNWEENYKEVFEKGKFDVVIGNPPYISFGLRGVERIKDSLSKYLRDNYKSAEYKISTYAVFIEKAISLLKHNGYFGFIVPDSFLLGKYFSKLRKYILDHCSIKGIVLFREDFWKSGVVGLPVIILLKRDKNANERKQNMVTAISCESLDAFKVGKHMSHSYPQGYYHEVDYHRFRLFFDSMSMKIVKKMESGNPPKVKLGDILSLASGLIGKAGKDEIVSKHKNDKNWLPGLLSGSEIDRYILAYEGNYINYDIKKLKSGFKDAKYDEPKILIRQTGDDIVASYDKDNYLCLNNLHVGNLINDQYDMRYILAILNSKSLNKYYQLISLEKGRAMAQTDIETLNLLPICKIEDKQQLVICKSIVDLVDEIFSSAVRYAKIRDKETTEKQQLYDRIERLKRDIDKHVYKLYDLTKDEIDYIEED